MRRTLLPFLLATTALISGCGSQASDDPAPSSAQAETLSASEEPDAAQARLNGEACPYLDSDWLAEANGQKVTAQGIDSRFSTPACVFWSYGDAPQARVMVRHMPSEDEAVQVIDWAAPVETTEPAEQPEGWSGGRLGGPEGSVYAVQKGDVAVVAWSDQAQSVKAQRIVEETIAALEL